MQKIYVLYHQSEYMQAPYLFPEKRWFFFVCGYAAGKTKANVISLLYAVKKLQGKKDRAGDYARLMVAGYTLAHLNKTFLVYLRQILDQSRTKYTENRKDNFFVIGTVTVFVIPMENPENIFGMDVAACIRRGTKVLARRQAKARYIAIENMTAGDEVFTRCGWRKVARVIPKGKKHVIRINRLWCTPDHKIWSKRWREAGELAKSDCVCTTSLRRVKAWTKLCGLLRQAEASVSCLTESRITGIRTEKTGIKSAISSARKFRAASVIFMWRYGSGITGTFRQDMLSIIETASRMITVLKILRRNQEESIVRSTTTYGIGTLSSWRNSAALCGERAHTRAGYFMNGIASFAGNILSRIITILRAVPGVAIISRTVNRRNQNGNFRARGAERHFRRTAEKPVSVARNAMTLINTLKENLQASLCVREEFVKYAGKFSRPLSVLLALPVLRIVKMLSGDKQYEVYDLTVDGHGYHEFFANGILAHNCFVEELDELTEDKAIEAVRSLSERCRQQIPGERSPHLCLASTSQGQKGLYRIYNHFKKNGTGFVLIRGRTQDNIFLPKELIADMLRTYTQEERRVFMDGEFLSIAKGRVLGDFNWERNYLDYDLDTELLPEETVYIGMDFNQNFSRASAYITRDGVIYCVKYYDFADPRDAPSVFRHDFPEQRILWIPDVTIKDSFPVFARELRKHGIQIIYRKKSPLVEDTAFLVNKLFYTGRLMVCKIAKDLAEACALFMRDKDNKIPKGKGPNDAAHAVDGLRYACAFICMRDKAFHDIRRLVIDKRASFRSDSDRPVQDLGSGYTQIHPDALYRGRKL